MAAAPMRRLGQVSFGWYLWQWPVLLLDETLAELIAVTIHRTLEPAQPIPAERYQPLAAPLLDYVNQQLEINQKRFQQEIE